MQDLPDIPQPRRHVMIRHMGKDNDAVLVRGLRKSYQGHQAVGGIDLSLSEPAWADAVHRPRSGRGGGAANAPPGPSRKHPRPVS
jgi:hypothetical protein